MRFGTIAIFLGGITLGGVLAAAVFFWLAGDGGEAPVAVKTERPEWMAAPQVAPAAKKKEEKPRALIVGVIGPETGPEAEYGLAVLTGFLATYGKDAVAGYGAAGRLQSFAVVPLLALSGSIGAIVGQNWGAEQEGRARKALLYAVGFAVAYGTVIAAILVIFARTFAGLFSDSAPVVDAAAHYLVIAAWGYGLYGALIVSNGALNAIDKASSALMVSVGRVLLVMVPAAWALGAAFGQGGVFGAELAANLIGGSIAFWIAYRVLRGGAEKERARSANAGAPSNVQAAE